MTNDNKLSQKDFIKQKESIMKTKIQRFAKFFRAIFFIALIVSPLLTGIVWLSGGEVLVLGEDNPAMAIKELTADLPSTKRLFPIIRCP